MKLWFVLFIFFSFAFTLASVDRTKYYDALASASSTSLVAQRKTLESLKSSSEQRAFLGALTMKEAQFSKTPKEKLSAFNKGKNLLEAEINAHKSQVEFRFLRLMIQENAPKILKYNGQLNDDAAAIVKGYSNLNATLQKIILNYSKKSKVLSATKLVS